MPDTNKIIPINNNPFDFINLYFRHKNKVILLIESFPFFFTEHWDAF
jgi:hypothetical protein